MTQLRTESWKQSRQVASQEKNHQIIPVKISSHASFQVGVPIAETIYQKVQYIKKKKGGEKKKKKGGGREKKKE